MQRIVFVGNCQVLAISNLFRQFAWRRHEQALSYVAAYEELDDAGAEAIAQADLIIEQVFDVAPKTEVGGMNVRARRIFVPLVSCHFLWPFAGTAHPQNPSRPYLPAGPFPAEFGMSFLNRMIRDGVDPEAAADAFIDYDVPAHLDLDRWYEIAIDRQRRRDEMTGFNFATLIEANFRDERLFLTTYHPDRRVSLELVSGCFERMGVDPADIARMQRITRATPFPKGELPIHPAVAEHFGLRYLPAEPRFRFLHEGMLSFREIAVRYMRCDWNEPLEEAIARLKDDEPQAAEHLLVEALARNPRNAEAHAALGQAYRKLGRPDAAVAELLAALALEDGDAAIWAEFGAAKQATGDLAGAEEAFRAAISRDPFDAHYITVLAHFLMEHDRTADAAEVLREGIAADDRSAKLYVELGHIAQRAGNWPDAADAFRNALQIDATLPIRPALADALTLAGRPAEAVQALRDLPSVGDLDGETLAAEARALQAAGKAEEAIALLRDAVRYAPDNVDYRVALAESLFRAGVFAEAASELRVVCDRRPNDLQMWVRLGEAKLRLGAPEEAEAALRVAVGFGRNAHVHFLLAAALGDQGRLAEAADECRAMVSIEPRAAVRHQALGHALARTGDFAGSARALQQAVDLAPDNIALRIELIQSLLKANRAQEALAVAREAAACAAQSPGTQEHLARLVSEANNRLETEKAWEGAVSFEPSGD